jgi:hypothetical protein
MLHPVTIENDAIAMEVWPSIGGKVSSIIDKADKFELLFNFPDELPTEPQYDIPYVHSWYAGWDECFPAVAAGPYVGHPYNAVNVPDHGELWGIPTIAVPTKQGITTVWNGLRFGYRLTRKLWLDGPNIHTRYTLVNLAPFPFRFVWAMHALMSWNANVPVQIKLPKSTMMRISHDSQGRESNEWFTWPCCPTPQLDFARLQDLPPKQGWKLYSMDKISTPAVVRYPTRNRSVEISYTSGSGDANADDNPATVGAAGDAVDAYWGLWINTGGWSAHHHFAIEPTTGRFDQVDRAVKDSSAGTVAASAQANWSVTWSLK